MVVNVMAIFRILSKSGKISIKFLSLVCYDIWKNFPQTTLSSLPFETCFSFTPHIFPMLSPKGHIYIAVWLLGNPGCLTIGNRNVSGSHLYIRTASKNLIRMKVTIKCIKYIWLIPDEVYLQLKFLLARSQKCLWTFECHLTRGQWWTLCQNNSDRSID